MKPAPILVLIVNYRTAPLTVRALGAILPELRARGDAQVLIVDNGSGDGSAERIAEAIEQSAYGDCASLLALNANVGFGAGNNAGLAHYRAVTGRQPDHVWLLNPDTIAEPLALTELVDFLTSCSEAGVAGGRCLRADGSIRPSAFRFPSPLNEFLATLDLGVLRRMFASYDILLHTGDTPVRADWLSGSHMLIRGVVIERIGFFDPAYFLYFEETDFCARAAEAGFEAWHVPSSRILHIGGQSTGIVEGREEGRRPRYWFASRARFMLDRYGRVRTHLANLSWLAAAPAGALIAKLRGRPRADVPHLWRDFLTHYYGPAGLMYCKRDVAS